MSWWYWYFLCGLLVVLLAVAWDSYASTAVKWPKSPADRLIDYCVSFLAGCAIVVGWPLALIIQLRDIATYKEVSEDRYQDFRVSRKHLVKQMTVREIELLETTEDLLGCVPAVPFGFLNATWIRFAAPLLPFEKLWSFFAREVNGFDVEEREGYAVVRFGRIQRVFTTSCRKVDGDL